MKITLTELEAEQLLGLLDLAIKAGGIQVARAAIAIQEKLHAEQYHQYLTGKSINE